MRAVILFDIDGTLLVTGGAGSRAMKSAWRSLLGRDVLWEGVVVGTPDPLLFEALARANGAEPDEELHDRYKSLYLQELKRELGAACDAGEVRRLPGVDGLLADLAKHQSDGGLICAGLLSGNYPEAAGLKFLAAGLDDSVFSVRALARARLMRNELADEARMMAERLIGPGTVEPVRLVVVGDTPRDIDAARAIDAAAVSVCTGFYGREQLAARQPDLIMDDLSAYANAARLVEDAWTAKAR